MAQPSVTTVTIDGQKFNAFAANVSLTTTKRYRGHADDGLFKLQLQVSVAMHDNVNMPFSTLKHLFELANVVTRDKIKDIKIEFWQDDSRQDALCTYTFKGRGESGKICTSWDETNWYGRSLKWARQGSTRRSRL